MSEIIFEVREDEVDGGFTFDETMEQPKIIRLHFVRDEVLA